MREREQEWWSSGAQRVGGRRWSTQLPTQRLYTWLQLWDGHAGLDLVWPRDPRVCRWRTHELAIPPALPCRLSAPSEMWLAALPQSQARREAFKVGRGRTLWRDAKTMRNAVVLLFRCLTSTCGGEGSASRGKGGGFLQTWASAVVAACSGHFLRRRSGGRLRNLVQQVVTFFLPACLLP